MARNGGLEMGTGAERGSQHGGRVEVWAHQALALQVPQLSLERGAEAANNQPGKPPQRDVLGRKRHAGMPGEGIRGTCGQQPSGAWLQQRLSTERQHFSERHLLYSDFMISLFQN